MRRITLWLLSTVAALVLAFSYRTSTMGIDGGANVAAVAPAATPDVTAADPTSAPSTTADGGDEPEPTATAAAPASGDGTYEGSTVQTRWGPIQVTITVAEGRITDVAVPVYPNENHRDQEINAYALPALREATLAAQSADIDTVSGATVTSDGYEQSLQAAIDQAHL